MKFVPLLIFGFAMEDCYDVRIGWAYEFERCFSVVNPTVIHMLASYQTTRG